MHENNIGLMDKASMTFIVYLIHELADSKGLYPGQVYHSLKKSGCIDNYLVPNYEILHTLGTQYLLDDISSYISSQGGSI